MFRLLYLTLSVAIAAAGGHRGLSTWASSGNEARVSSGSQLAYALADQNIGRIWLASSIVLQSEDFLGLPLPLEVTRNVTIAGSTAHAWPVLDLNYVRDKVRLRRGVQLLFTALLLDHISVTSPSIAPGVDLILPNLPGEVSYVGLTNGGVTISACYPPPYNAANMGSMQRPADYPGSQRVRFAMNQTGCIVDARALALTGPSANGGRPNSKPLGGSPYPPLDICWAVRHQVLDVVLPGGRMASQAAAVATPTGHIIIHSNATFLCRVLLAPACIEALGPAGCLFHTVPPVNLAASSEQWEAAAALEDNGGSNGMLPAVLAGVLGGVAIVGILMLLLGLRYRRRRQRRQASEVIARVDAVELPTITTDKASGEGGATLVVLVDPAALPSRSSPVQVQAGAPAAGAPAARPAGMELPGDDDMPVTILTPFRPDVSFAVLGEACGAAAPSATQRAAVSSGAGAGAGPGGHVVGDTGSCTASGLGGSNGGERGPPAAGARPVDGGPERCASGAAREASMVVHLLPDGRLGAGSFGHVRKAVYAGKEVAVKLLKHEWGRQPEAAVPDSLRREVEVLGRCQHPNVVRLLAACTTPPHMCLVMELMECSLEALLYGSGAELPLAKALQIGQQIAQGLAYLHPTIFHRDLKPANVLLNNPLDPRPEVKISDFGVSKLVSTCVLTTNPEQGTPAYAPPEAYDPSNTRMSCKADIYSLGVILWEMLARKKPWQGCSQIAIGVALVMNKARLPLDGLDESRCPPRLRELLGACWEEDPQRRPAAAEVVKVLALVQQLRHVRDGGCRGDSAEHPTRSSLGLSLQSSQVSCLAADNAATVPESGGLPQRILATSIPEAAAAAAAAGVQASSGGREELSHVGGGGGA